MDSRLLLGVTIALVAATALLLFGRMVSAFTGNLGKRATNPKSGKPGAEIELHSIFIPRQGCGGTVSPFTTKIECFLRMAGLAYRVRSCDLQSSPNGRIPWMQHGDQQVADSRFIIRFLQNIYGDDLRDIREPAAAAEQALSVTIQRLCEQHMYFTNLYYGAATSEGRRAAPKLFAGLVPTPMNYVVARAWWTGRTTQLRYQGTLTCSHEDINTLVVEDLTTLAALLGDKPFFFGPHPSAADACVFGFLEAHTHGAGGGFIASVARKHDNLVRFVDRIQKAYFADRLQHGFKLD